MEPLMPILLAILLGALVTIAIGVYKHLTAKTDELRKDFNRLNDQYIYLDTYLSILLAHYGFDMNKVNHAIREHMDELKQNNKPSVGCIDYKSLYKETTT